MVIVEQDAVPVSERCIQLGVGQLEYSVAPTLLARASTAFRFDESIVGRDDGKNRKASFKFN